MIAEVEKWIRQWDMIPEHARVLVGVSGGADSVCLCLILLELSKKMDFSMEVIHVEHGIRGTESQEDAAFVENLCAGLGVTCHTRHVDVPAYAKARGLGEEEAARILRYQVFAETAKGGKQVRIALAHHMEDNAETMLFQLIRGSGLDGLCGMRPKRTGEAGEWYIRPLLTCSRQQIEAFLKERGQAYCIDSTNADLAYSRNRMRKRVLPELVQINPQAVQHMQNAMQQLGDVRAYMEAETLRQQETLLIQKDGGVYLDVAGLCKLPEAMRMRLIRKAVQTAAGAQKDLTAAHLYAVAELFKKQTGKAVGLPYGLTALREYGAVVIAKKRPPAEAVCVLVEAAQIPGQLCVLGWEFSFRIVPYDGKLDKIPRKMYTKWFDYDKIKNGLTIRNRRKGDFFVLDAAGHHKKLEDYFVNEKIPAARRDACPLLAAGNEIFWIVGGRMAYGAGISAATKQVLEVTAKAIEGGKEDGL